MGPGIVRIVIGALLTVLLGAWAGGSLVLLLTGLASGGNGATLIGNALGLLTATLLTWLAYRRLLLRGVAERRARRTGGR